MTGISVCTPAQLATVSVVTLPAQTPTAVSPCASTILTPQRPSPAGPSKQAVDVDTSPAGPGSSSNGGTAAPKPAGHPDGGCLALLLQHVASPAELAASSKPRIPQDSLAMLMALAARDPEMLMGLGASKTVGDCKDV